MKKTKIRLLLVDDHFFVRMGLALSLNAESDMQVVADADSGARALKLYREHRPDVVVLDNRLPDISGVQTLAALRREFPDARALMLSIDEGEEDVYRALEAGAAGYLPKATQSGELLQAIRAVYSGQRYLHPALADRLAQRGPNSTLTERELEVLELISKGLTNRQIGELLGCAEITIKFHVSNLMRKMEVPNRAEAVRAAIERGIFHV